MSLICPAKKCKAKKGPCNHEKIMLGLIVVVIVILLIRYLI